MTHPIQQRAIDLHEKAGMPWSEAEALALSEAGIDDAAIRELEGECTSSTILTGDDIPNFVRSVLVHGSALYANPAAQPLSDEQIDDAIQRYVDPVATYRKLHNFARAIERAITAKDAP